MKAAAALTCAALTAAAFPADADIFKYTDARGHVYFTDKPMSGPQYKLEWSRSTRATPDYLMSTPPLVARSQYLPKAGGKQSKKRGEYDGLIRETANRYRLHPELLHAVVQTESAYNPGAVSSAGAVGLMQLMPDTARRYGVRDIWDPKENVKGGASYLRDLLDMFDNDLRLALAAYNAGENAVVRYGNQIPPYSETQDYVRKVIGSLRTQLTLKNDS
jgi:soluble lytic murein transglycosylase-like protein